VYCRLPSLFISLSYLILVGYVSGSSNLVHSAFKLDNFSIQITGNMLGFPSLPFLWTSWLWRCHVFYFVSSWLECESHVVTVPPANWSKHQQGLKTPTRFIIIDSTLFIHNITHRPPGASSNLNSENLSLLRISPVVSVVTHRQGSHHRPMSDEYGVGLSNTHELYEAWSVTLIRLIVTWPLPVLICHGVIWSPSFYLIEP